MGIRAHRGHAAFGSRGASAAFGVAVQTRRASAGISEDDLEAVVEGNLIGNVLEALDAAEFRQIYRDQSAEQERDDQWGDRDRDLF